MRNSLAVFVILSASPAYAQSASSLSEEVRQYVAVDAPVFALTNVTLIDGTGAPAKRNQVIVIADGVIQAVGGMREVRVPAGAEVLEFEGHTVFPGMIGLHNHMYFNMGGGDYATMPYSYPRLYLAGGMTTTRSTGSMNPYKEINLKRAIDEGEVPGPKMHITGPYLQGPGPGPKMHPLTGPEDARRMVAYWADEGVTWFKAYTQISREALGAAINEAHKRGIKVTAHLCSVGFREAVALGIDNLEHGLTVNTEYHEGKRPDQCPVRSRVDAYADLDVSSAQVRRTIADMVEHGVAITSTLVVSEGGMRTIIDERVLDVLAPTARRTYLTRRELRSANRDPRMDDVLRRAMEFEHAFARAGGVLAAGSDATGSVIPGFADQRQVELLVEAGFTLEEAIQVASANGARVLGVIDKTGTVTTGKQADLVLVRGDLTRNLGDIRNVVLVFKDGVGYDSAKLLESVRGMVGIR